MPCLNCTKDRPIVNKKYGLCVDCNSIRLNGVGIAERQAESVKKYQAKYAKRVADLPKKTVKPDTRSGIRITESAKKNPIGYKPIKQQTTSEAAIKKQLSILKRDIELEAVQNNEYYCAGCGISYPGLDKSHILSVGQYKHLELVKRNIQLMCRNTARNCHTTWESGPITAQMALNCFVDNLHFIYQHDPLFYQRFITRIENYRILTTEEQQAKIDALLTAIREVEK